MTATLRSMPAMRDEDWKDLGKRIVDPVARKRCLLIDRECRVCGGPPSEAHHVLWRGDLGDDVDANLIPLCTHCHNLYHRATGKDWRIVARAIAVSLTADNVSYVEEKLGPTAWRPYLRRRYRWRTNDDPRLKEAA